MKIKRDGSERACCGPLWIDLHTAYGGYNHCNHYVSSCRCRGCTNYRPCRKPPAQSKAVFVKPAVSQNIAVRICLFNFGSFVFILRRFVVVVVHIQISTDVQHEEWLRLLADSVLLIWMTCVFSPDVTTNFRRHGWLGVATVNQTSCQCIR